jgi:hypothetical protein
MAIPHPELFFFKHPRRETLEFTCFGVFPFSRVGVVGGNVVVRLHRRGYHHSDKHGDQHQNGEDVHRPRKSPERIKENTKSKFGLINQNLIGKRKKKSSVTSSWFTRLNHKSTAFRPIHNGQDIERLVSGSKIEELIATFPGDWRWRAKHARAAPRTSPFRSVMIDGEDQLVCGVLNEPHNKKGGKNKQK